MEEYVPRSKPYVRGGVDRLPGRLAMEERLPSSISATNEIAMDERAKERLAAKVGAPR
jgi:hypothetical protein